MGALSQYFQDEAPHDTSEKIMQLRILGSGDAFSGGGRLTSCYIVEGGPTRFMVDCGQSVLAALHRTALSTNDIPLIFISHLHGDHFGGLPFLFIDAVYPRQRRTPLIVVGPPGLENRFHMACEVLYPRIALLTPAFDLQFIELETNVRREVEGLTVTPFEADHYSGAPSYAYRFEIGEKVFAFSGDTGWCKTVFDVGRGADLYLLECYQYDLQLAMHLDYLTIQKNYEQINAKRIVLTHMGDGMLANHNRVDRTRYELAEDGMTVDF